MARTSARRPKSRAARISLVARIHRGTLDLVCSITGIMPIDLGEQRRGPGSGAEIGGHGIDKRVGVVQHKRHQPVDPVAPQRDAGGPVVQ